MKINEFINGINGIHDVHAYEKDSIVYVSELSEKWFLGFNPNIDDSGMAYDWSALAEISPEELRAVLNLVKKFRETPVKERFPEKKYRLRFAGLNSDNGKQYLSCRHMNSNFFACALRSDLKQEFAKDEIDALMNKPQFKSIPWFKELIREGIEEVPDDER